MNIGFHRNFIKQYKRVPKSTRFRVGERLELFELNALHPLLNTHPLTGNRTGQWSINITGDWRAIFVYQDRETVIFIDLDTHSNLYK